jgi:hypothetical protein
MRATLVWSIGSLPLMVPVGSGPDLSKANADKGLADVVFRCDLPTATSLGE